MIRPPKRRFPFEPTLFLARLIVTCFRGVFRVLEVFGRRDRRPKYRQFRKQMEAIEAEKRRLLATVGERDALKSVRAMREMLAKFDGPDSEQVRSTDGLIDRLEEMRAESAALQAIRNDSAGDIEAEIRGIREYLARHAESSLAHTYLGMALAKRGLYSESVDAFRRAAELSDGGPSYYNARQQVAMALHKSGDSDAGIRELEDLIGRTPPGDGTLLGLSYYHLGLILRETGQEWRAQQAWKQAVKHNRTGTLKEAIRKQQSEGQ